jgi:putative ABC transport system ATP-binding protein
VVVDEPPMPEPVLDFEGVHVVAPDGAEILRGVHLDVAPARLTVLAGASGSGKSTLLRLANRLEVPSSGVVRFRGRDVATLDPLALRREVGMVFQRPTTFPGSVRQNLQVAAPGGEDAAFLEVLGRVGLTAPFLERAADDLSGGEAQRMCLARTLLTGPSVVLMDEVTSSLDPASRRAIEDLGRGLVDDGLTVVWVTHDMGQMARIADAVAVLVDGRLADPAAQQRYLAQAEVAEPRRDEGAGDGRPDPGEAA